MWDIEQFLKNKVERRARINKEIQEFKDTRAFIFDDVDLYIKYYIHKLEQYTKKKFPLEFYSIISELYMKLNRNIQKEMNIIDETLALGIISTTLLIYKRRNGKKLFHKKDFYRMLGVSNSKIDTVNNGEWKIFRYCQRNNIIINNSYLEIIKGLRGYYENKIVFLNQLTINMGIIYNIDMNKINKTKTFEGVVKTLLENNFYDCVEKMRQILYSDELYAEGGVYITYDRVNHKYYVNEDTGMGGIPINEWNGSEYYCQITVIGINTEDIREEYSNFRYENDIDEISDEQRKEIVDNMIDNVFQEQEMEADERAALFELDRIERGRTYSDVAIFVEKNGIKGLKKFMNKKGIFEEIQEHILEMMD